MMVYKPILLQENIFHSNVNIQLDNTELVVTDTTDVIFIDEECNEFEVPHVAGNPYQYSIEGDYIIYVKVGQSDSDVSQYHIHFMESNSIMVVAVVQTVTLHILLSTTSNDDL